MLLDGAGPRAFVLNGYKLMIHIVLQILGACLQFLVTHVSDYVT